MRQEMSRDLLNFHKIIFNLKTKATTAVVIALQFFNLI